jgi:hypothetical protein
LLQPSIINHLIQVCPAAVMLMGISHVARQQLVLSLSGPAGFSAQRLPEQRLKVWTLKTP